MLAQFRSFLAVIEEGSLHRAAARLNISQSALSRQMQAIEHELGGPILERSTTGVKPTSGGHELAAKMAPVLASYDAALVDIRRRVRGERDLLRIGCMGSAAEKYLTPGIRNLRRAHPGTRVNVLDLSPGEQIAALRRGEIDVAVMDVGADLLARDFYARKLATVSSIVVFPAGHPLAKRRKVRIAELKDETFIGGVDRDVPGYNQRLTRLCRKCGSFRPRFIGQPDSLAEALGMVAEENAIALLPAFMAHRATACLRAVPVTDSEATWDLMVIWQRGRIAASMRALLDGMTTPKV